MKLKSWILALLMATTPAAMFAQSAQSAPPAQSAAPTPEQVDAADEQQTPDPSEVRVPTPEELAEKLESQNEALTTIQNALDFWTKLKISGYIQAQYVDDESSVNELTSATATRNKNQFSIRRGRVKLVYQATPWARITIQPDISTAATPVVLKDGFVELIEQHTPWHHTLTAGQFNWPFGFEIGYSSSDREMPERSRVIRSLFPGERDRGIQVSGLSPNAKFNYKVAVVNGTGTTAPFDANEDKDIVGRVGLSLGRFDVGASGYNGTDLVSTSAAPKGVEFDKTRYGADFQLVTPIPGLLTRGEYIIGEEKGADVKGWYAYLVQNVGTRHQFVLRADQYDPNTDIDKNAIFTIGGSYIFHWDSNSKIMFAYEKPKTQKNDPKDNVTTVRFQYKF